MHLTTLIEDTTRSDLLASEPGLSLYVETRGMRILFDTGQSGIFVENSKALGIDLSKIDLAVISHAHDDHGGGLAAFLKINHSAPVYMHANAVNACFGNIGAELPLPVSRMVHPLIHKSKLFSKYIGFHPECFSEKSDRIKFITVTTQVLPNLFLMSGFEKRHPSVEGNKFLLTMTDGKLEYDDFSHEIIAVIRDVAGLVLLTGCGHSGVLNMIETVSTFFPDEPIRAVIGGFHLKLQPKRNRMAGGIRDIETIAEVLLSKNIEAVYTGHCTGTEAYGKLKERLADRIKPLYTGLSIEL